MTDRNFDATVLEEVEATLAELRIGLGDFGTATQQLNNGQEAIVIVSRKLAELVEVHNKAAEALALAGTAVAASTPSEVVTQLATVLDLLNKHGAWQESARQELLALTASIKSGNEGVRNEITNAARTVGAAFRTEVALVQGDLVGVRNEVTNAARTVEAAFRTEVALVQGDLVGVRNEVTNAARAVEAAFRTEVALVQSDLETRLGQAVEESTAATQTIVQSVVEATEAKLGAELALVRKQQISHRQLLWASLAVACMTTLLSAALIARG